MAKLNPIAEGNEYDNDDKPSEELKDSPLKLISKKDFNEHDHVPVTNSIESTSNSEYSILEGDEDDDESITSSIDRKKIDVSSSLKSIGKLMELFEAQLVIIALIILDLIALATENYFTCNNSRVQHSQMFESHGFVRFLQTFTTFTLIIFLLEIIALMIAFGRRFFSHIGYTMDTFIVFSCFLCEMSNSGKMMRLLGFARLWRIARLVITTLNMVQSEHEKDRTMLREERHQTKKLKNELDVKENTLREEKKARKMVERMLQSYKDEVDTLKEALEIAAFHVSSVSPKSDESILQDIADRVSSEEKAFNIATKGTKDSYVIHEDGTFESPRSVTY